MIVRQQDFSRTSAILVISLLWTSCFVANAASISSASHLLSLAETQPLTSGGSRASPVMSGGNNNLIFNVPTAMQNLLQELVVTSRSLNLRKRYSAPASIYSSSAASSSYAGNTKRKQNRKDSRIYYISMPPMPYRFIPGIGYDYQPMKIKPLMAASEPQQLTPQVQAVDHHQTQFVMPGSSFSTPQNAEYSSTSNSAFANDRKQDKKKEGAITTANAIIRPADRTSSSMAKDSKIYHLSPNSLGSYFFNGRPTRLQVAHGKKGHPKKGSPANELKSSSSSSSSKLMPAFYFNKNFIY